MSNSVVKVTDVTDDTINDSLLLLVGEDGTVTPDRRTVENYLSSKTGPTSLQIMHIDKCDPKGIDVVVDNVTYIPDNMEVVNEEDIIAKDDATGINIVAINLYNIKLDHDYTPLTSPSRHSSSPDEDDELAKTLSLLHHGAGPESEESPPIVITVPPKANKAINIISSITIPAPGNPAPFSGSSASATPAKNDETAITEKAAPVRPKGKAKILHTTPKGRQKKVPAARGRKPAKTVIPEEESTDEEEESEEDEEVLEEEDDEESDDEDFDLEMEDDEDDSDFDIQEEISGKRGKKGTRKLSSEPKREARSSDPVKIPPSKTPRTPKVKKGKRDKGETPKAEPKLDKVVERSQPLETSLDKTAGTKTDEVASEEKNEKQAETKPEETKPPEKKHPKKKKEPPKPIPGDFALFSTPDIIRKVGGKEPGTPGTPEALPTTPKVPKAAESKPSPKVESPTTSRPGKITHESRSKSATEPPNSPSKHNRLSLDEKDAGRERNHSHYQRTSTESKTKDRRDSVEKHRHSKGVEEKHKHEHHSSGRNHSHDRRSSDSSSERKISSGSERDRRASDSNKFTSKHDHGHSRHDSPSKHSRHSSESQEAIPSAEDIRAIIMNEETRTYTTNTIPIPDAPVQLINHADPNALNLDASGLDLDQSILDNINNDMISEDILYQVAQQLVSNTELQNAIEKGINDGVLDTSGLHEAMDISSQMSHSSNSSFSESHVVKQGTQIVRPDGRILVLPPIERPTTRSRNKRKEEVVKPSFKTVHKPLDDEHVSGNELDSSGEEEEESEDDPNKLWCICNQPHNNRFMICCDTCEEWYHGKCVNITKAMGQQMESEGKEWICLFCKDSSLKRPMAAARRIRKASRNSRQSSDSNSSAKKNEKEKSSSALPCVVCQKAARKNSIYCSETCILAHAQGIEKVVVFERATGSMLTGDKAPSAANLTQWLKEHPGYEVVRSAGKVVTTKVKPTQLTQSKLKFVKNPNNKSVSLAIHQKGHNIGVLKHTPKQSSQATSQQSTPKTPKMIKIFQKDPRSKESRVKLIQPQPLPQPAKSKELTTPSKPKIQVQTLLAPKLPPPTTPTNKTPKKETTPKESKSKTPKSKKEKEEPQTPQPKQEDIRDNVQKTVFEQLLVRLKGGDMTLTDEEVKNISIEIEAELYKCFGDTGQKYKNKYRSIIFNIKDPKNQTLWRRICEKSISSYELVRLSPDDMASQELAKWREQEAKHQLDMIKKSEIELLNCNRQYVLKTHKGEEVLEDKRPGNKADNTAMIKSLTEGSTLDPGVEAKRTGSKDLEKDREKRGTSKHGHKEKNRDKGRHSSKERRDKEKEHKNRRSTSRDRDRSRKRSRSRDKSRHEKKKREKRSRSNSREREKSRERDKNKERDRHSKKSSHKSSRHKKSNAISSTDSLDKRSKEILEQLNKIAPPVEDRLWKHVPQEDIVPGNGPAESDSDHEVPTSTVTIATPPRSQEAEDFRSQSSEDSKASVRLKEVELDEESGSSPSPKSSATQIWSGSINMVDVAQISITAHEVSGDCSGLGKELSENLDIVGRISPDTVWDYIGKMRSSNSKIISLIRLNATNMEEQMPYLALYSYLSSRNRLGVVKSTNKAIKDFYILPLASQKPIPQALLPISGPVRQWLEASVKKINERVQNGFEEARPALLLGIIVRDKRKRSYLDPTPPTVTPHKKTRVEVHIIQAQPPRSYTPPPMPADVTPVPPPVPPPPPPQPKVDPRLAKFSTPPPLPPPVPPVPEMVPAPVLQTINSPVGLTLTPSMMSIVKPSQPSPTPPKHAVDEMEVANDDDEPYSPGDSDPDIVMETAPQPAAVLTTATAITVTQATITTEEYTPIPGLGDGTDDLSAKKMDIQRQMEELNKQIEMQKSEITSITKNIATAESEIVGSALASIALPSNLQQILDSIKTIGSTTPGESSNATAKEPPIPGTQTDLTIPLMIPKTFTRPLTSVPPLGIGSNTIPLNLPPTKSKLSPPLINSPIVEEKSASVLSSLSEEDLIKKAAEMLNEEESVSVKKPPARISFSIAKKPKLDVCLPPVPGIDD